MTHIYGNAIPVQKYLLEWHSHAFPHHYTSDCAKMTSDKKSAMHEFVAQSTNHAYI